MNMKKHLPDTPGRWWLFCAVVTMTAWGLWGGLIDSTARAGFPEALGYVVWTITMVPPAAYALHRVGWRLDWDRESVLLGGAVGLLGAGGQLVLFKVLRLAPAHLVFPIIALSPVVTVALAFGLLRERVAGKHWAGIVLSLAAGVLLAYSPPVGDAVGHGWIGMTLVVFFAWGVQGYMISRANRRMSAESVFFYMMVAALGLVPVALLMVDFTQPVNWGGRGFGAAVLIQSLNSVGALLLVYAFRHGKAMIVSPLVNAGAPMITILLSLVLYRVIPGAVNLAGLALALVATLLLAWEGRSLARPARVHYVELLPAEFRSRLVHCPVGYLPLGTLEWHGEYCPLGTDALIAQGLFERVAARYGGIVFPPLFLGPDRLSEGPDGVRLIGMEFDESTRPPRQLAGNCYWVSEDGFRQLCEAVLEQARRAGFRCIFADGHGPSRQAWARACPDWEKRFGLQLLGVVRDFPSAWSCQTDHAGCNETSLVAALRPELVDLARLPAERDTPVPAMIGADPRDATAEHGLACLAACTDLVGAKLIELGLVRAGGQDGSGQRIAS